MWNVVLKEEGEVVNLDLIEYNIFIFRSISIWNCIYFIVNVFIFENIVVSFLKWYLFINVEYLLL